MRDLIKMQKSNDGTRTLFESVMNDSLIQVLHDLINAEPNLVLIGGLAVSFYLKPRMTQYVDVLLQSDADIPRFIEHFKRTRKHTFQHNTTHTEMECVTPEFVGFPPDVVRQIIATARVVDGIKVASPSGLVASKLFRLSPYDVGDIIGLINFEPIDLSGFGLPLEQIQRYTSLVAQAETQKNTRDLSLDDDL
jgi:hypothetical protein